LPAEGGKKYQKKSAKAPHSIAPPKGEATRSQLPKRKGKNRTPLEGKREGSSAKEKKFAGASPRRQ